jgi:hypothetical protein
MTRDGEKMVLCGVCVCVCVRWRGERERGERERRERREREIVFGTEKQNIQMLSYPLFLMAA